MSQYYLEIVYDGTIIYRKESLKPLKIDNISIEIGICNGLDDIAIYTKRHL